MATEQQWQARNNALQVRIDRLEAEARSAPKAAKHKPSGKLDAKGAGTAVAGGTVCAPVGAWSQDIVDAIYAGVNDGGSTILRDVMHLKMVEDMTGLMVGFVVGTVCVGLWKFLKSYGTA